MTQLPIDPQQRLAPPVDAREGWWTAGIDWLRTMGNAARQTHGAGPVESAADDALIAAMHAELGAASGAAHAESARQFALQAQALQRVAAVAGATSNAVLITDAAGRIEWVNDAFVNASGKTLDAVRGNTPDALLAAPAADSPTLAFMRECVAAGRGFHAIEVMSHTASGRPIWALRDMQPVRDAAGKLVQFVVVDTDITARKHAEDHAERISAELRERLAELEELHRQTRLIAQLRDALQSADDAAEALRLAHRYAAAMIRGASGVLFGVDEDTGAPVRMCAWGRPPVSAQECAEQTCRAARRSRMRRSAEAPSPREDETICIPFASRGEVFGALYVRLAAGEQARGPAWQIAISFAETLTGALVESRLRESLRHQATRDPLTGLYNRRHLDDTLEREVRRCARKNRPLTVCMFDVDHFKRYNDTWGHDAGDAVLCQVADLVARHVRGDDFVCRFGGEEFVLVMPEADAAAILPRLEGLRDAIRHLQPEHRGERLAGITVSMGVAAMPEHAVGAGELLAEADRALYRAKEDGRDRIMVAEPQAEFLRTLAREIV